MNVAKRIAAIQGLMAKQSLDGLICSRYQSIAYVSGVFQRWGTVLLIPREGRPVVISAERRRVEDEAWAPELMEFMDAQLVGEPENPPKLKALAQKIKALKLGGKKLGIEKAHLPWAEMEELAKLLPKAELVDASKLVPSLMLIKDAEEIKALRRVAEIADAAMSEALDSLIVGISELEVAGLIDLAVRRTGGDKTWFPTHVCSGYRANFDMAYPTAKLVQFNDRVVVDIGPMYDLYCGQLNTHVVVGTATAEDRKLFGGVADVHRKVIDSLKPGKKAKDVFKTAWDYAHKLGWSGCLAYFGRGIGIIDNEELLMFSPSCPTVLKPGMVAATVTYIRDGKRTISTERMVLITEEGAEELSTYPLQLIEL